MPAFYKTEGCIHSPFLLTENSPTFTYIQIHPSPSLIGQVQILSYSICLEFLVINWKIILLFEILLKYYWILVYVLIKQKPDC